MGEIIEIAACRRVIFHDGRSGVMQIRSRCDNTRNGVPEPVGDNAGRASGPTLGRPRGMVNCWVSDASYLNSITIETMLCPAYYHLSLTVAGVAHTFNPPW